MYSRDNLGRSICRLFYKALSCEYAPAYVRRLLAASPIDQSDDASKSQAQTSEFDWVEPLSKRELEILQLITEGLTNHEISATLYLSPQAFHLNLDITLLGDDLNLSLAYP